MKNETQIRALVVLSLLSLITLTFFYVQQSEELRKCKVGESFIPGGDIQKANLIDSLHDELFNAKTINGRYELSLEHLKETNPKAAKDFENFLNTQTE